MEKAKGKGAKVTEETEAERKSRVTDGTKTERKSGVTDGTKAERKSGGTEKAKTEGARVTDETKAEQKARVTDETEVGTTEMAMVLGVTARRVQQMIQDGTLQTVRRGVLLLADNVQRYITFITGSQMTEEERKTERARKAAESKLKTAKAEIATLEANELKGRMHRSEDVEAMTQDLCDTIRTMLMSLPGRLAVDVSICDSAEECSILIRDSVNAVLTELSGYEYDPAKYEERVRAREKMEQKPDDDE